MIILGGSQSKEERLERQVRWSDGGRPSRPFGSKEGAGCILQSPDVEGTDSDGLRGLAQGVHGAGRSLFLPVGLVRRTWVEGENDTPAGGGTMHREVHTKGEAERGLENDIKTWSLDTRNREAYRRKWFGDESDDLN